MFYWCKLLIVEQEPEKDFESKKKIYWTIEVRGARWEAALQFSLQLVY